MNHHAVRLVGFQFAELMTMLKCRGDLEKVHPDDLFVEGLGVERCVVHEAGELSAFAELQRKRTVRFWNTPPGRQISSPPM